MKRLSLLVVALALLAPGCRDSTAPIAPRHDLDIVVPTIPTPAQRSTVPASAPVGIKDDIPPEYLEPASSTSPYTYAWFGDGDVGNALASGSFFGTDASVKVHGIVDHLEDSGIWKQVSSADGEEDGWSQIVPKSGSASSEVVLPNQKNCDMRVTARGDFYAAVKYLGQIISGGPIPVKESSKENGACTIALITDTVPASAPPPGQPGGDGSTELEPDYTTCLVEYWYVVETGQIIGYSIIGCW